MHLVLALVAAATWGASDFVGGLVGRRVPGASVAFASQLVGLAGLAVVAPLAGGSASGADLGWGAASGLGGATGVAFLYHGLAVGQMSVVAPLTAVGSATLPVVFGLLTGERPSPVALAGVVLALVAVGALCSFGPAGDGGEADEEGAGRPPAAGRAGLPSAGAGLVSGIAAGVGFGAFFICLGRTSAGAGMWPLVPARVVSVSVLAGLVLATRRALMPGGGTAPAVVLAGALDVTANAAFLLATRRGLLSIVSLLASLYPAATVVLARFLLHERLTPAQSAGLAGAAVAVALIVLG
ncbi:MAG: EamA family transporter [Acidimicrobiia bacterium]